VGYYLIDKGQPALERAVKVRWPWRTIFKRSVHRFPLTFYAGGIFLFTAIATLGLILQTHGFDARGWKFVVFTFVFLLCSSQLAVALMNWLATLFDGSPRLDYSPGRAGLPRWWVLPR
jgi:hypothetical protein